VLEVSQFILDRAVAERPIFTEDEVARWPEGLQALLSGYDLIHLTDNADSVVCDACGHDHVEPVIKVSSPSGTGLRAFITCPEAGRVVVPLDRLRQRVLDVPNLCGMTGWTPSAPEVGPKVNDPICLTITEAAKYVGVSDRTIRQWRTDGKLVVLEDEHGQLIFSKSSLEILRIARA